MYPPEEDEPDENADASKEPEQEEVGLSRARAWLKAEMKTHAKAERKRLRDEKYKDRPPTAKEPEEEERDLTHAKAWLKAQMEADAEAEKKRLRDEKYKDRPPTAEEYLQDLEEDEQWEQEKNKQSQKLHISALLHQLKIYATE
jgi:hypothetical protein